MRNQLILSVTLLGALALTLVPLPLLIGFSNHLPRSWSGTITGVAAISLTSLLALSMILPLVLHRAKPPGFEEYQAAFRWAADRPGQGARGLPLGPLAQPGRALREYKDTLRYRFVGPILTILGLISVTVGLSSATRWALLGGLLVPAGICLHRWSTGKSDAPQAARDLIARYVASLGRDEHGLFSDVAGAWWGRPRHRSGAPLHWEVTGNGMLACTLVDSRFRRRRARAG